MRSPNNMENRRELISIWSVFKGFFKGLRDDPLVTFIGEIIFGIPAEKESVASSTASFPTSTPKRCTVLVNPDDDSADGILVECIDLTGEDVTSSDGEMEQQLIVDASGDGITTTEFIEVKGAFRREHLRTFRS